MIPVYQPHLTGNEKKYVNECLDSTWISSKGEFIEKFESGFKNFTGAGYASSVSNGTTALHVALEALQIGDGDEVIVPTFTYIASVNTIIQTGATPIYVDSNTHDLQIDVNDVRRKISPRTKAIMAVHLYGQACEMRSLQAISKENKLFLIEDCAEALGTRIGDKHVGTFGDIATFSFFGNKTLTTGEGGMVISREKKVIDRVNLLKNQGVIAAGEYHHACLAYNYRMTNICAAIGLAQLEAIDTILDKKRKIALCYDENLRGLPLKTHKEQEGTTHSFWMCSVILDNPEQRDTLRAYLKDNGVDTRPFFYPAHKMPHCASTEHFENAENISQRGINLPSYPDLDLDKVLEICAVIKAFFNKEEDAVNANRDTKRSSYA